MKDEKSDRKRKKFSLVWTNTEAGQHGETVFSTDDFEKAYWINVDLYHGKCKLNKNT